MTRAVAGIHPMPDRPRTRSPTASLPKPREISQVVLIGPVLNSQTEHAAVEIVAESRGRGNRPDADLAADRGSPCSRRLRRNRRRWQPWLLRDSLVSYEGIERAEFDGLAVATGHDIKATRIRSVGCPAAARSAHLFVSRLARRASGQSSCVVPRLPRIAISPSLVPARRRTYCRRSDDRVANQCWRWNVPWDQHSNSN